MTWQSAQEEAARRIALLPLPPAPPLQDDGRSSVLDLAGLEITVLDFDSEQTCYLLTGARPVNFHKQVLQAIRRQLAKRGARVMFKMIPLSDTLRWGNPYRVAVMFNDGGPDPTDRTGFD